MSLTLPLAVRIANSKVDVHVTRWLRDLTFREVATGGYASATFSIDRPLSLQPAELAYYSSIYIYDCGGGTVWEGRLEDLGVENATDGQVWRISALGPSAHVHDRTIPVIYVDRDVSRWVKARSAGNEIQGATVTAGDDPTGGSNRAITLSFPNSQTVNAGSACTAYYLAIENAGQNLAVVDYAWETGLTSPTWFVRGQTESSDIFRDQDTDPNSGITSTATTASWTHPRQRPILQYRWTGGASTTGSAGTVWCALKDVVVAATTYNASGSEITSYTSADRWIKASTVVNDLLGRVLDKYDGANADVDTTTHDIEQLAYPDGATPGEILEDLMEFEPGYRWGAYESNSSGLHRFEWKAWPTEVRYEATAAHGFTSPASADKLFNAAKVAYIDRYGTTAYASVTSTVAELDDAGLTREEFLTAQEGASSTDATELGEQFLEEHATPPASGTLTVAGPIIDLVDGRMVQPWQIRAGQLIRIREVQPRVAALTASGRDGLSTFKIASREFRADTGTAVLELDEYTMSTARALAAATKPKPKTKRRKR